MDQIMHLVFDGAIAFLGSVFMYFLKRRDDDQEKQIVEFKKTMNDLYILHNADVDRLRDLEIHIAQNTFSKVETNFRLEEQRRYFDSRFDRIEKLLDEIRK